MSDDVVLGIMIYAVPMILAITVHEAAHGYVASYFGDQTARERGRLSLNPFRHIDPLGTVILPALLWLTKSAVLFGWAKPVPVNFANLRNPKANMLWVAAAGPASNFVMAVLWALLARFTANTADPQMTQMATVGIRVNLSLMALNLLPIPPLDGGRILVSLLPARAAYAVSRIERFGMLIVIALAYTGLLWAIMRPILMLAYLPIRLIF